MGRPTLNEVQAVFADALPTDRFEFLLGNLPGGIVSDNLRVMTQQVSIPGITIEPFEVAVHGQVLRYPGRKLFNGTISATFVENAGTDAQRALRTWSELCKSTNTGKSVGTKRDFAVNARLNVYDNADVVRDEVDIIGLWLSELSEIQLDGQASQAMQIQCTFTYDVWRSTLHPYL